jgi:hypothetical protein
MSEAPVEAGVDDVQPVPRKTGRGHFDVIVSLTAIFISTVSLYVAIQHGKTERDLVAANVWPFPRAILSNGYGNRGSIAIGVSNGGVGPAKISSFELFYRGRPVSSGLDLLRQCCGLGIEKLTTANYQAKIDEGHEGESVRHIIESSLAWIESQQFQMFISVNLGSWSGSSVRKMCDEIGDPDLYKFSYTPFSACVHNMWNHVGKWNARTCQNPLHKRHAIGRIADTWPIIDFLFRACKYLELVLDEFDGYYQYTSRTVSPTDAFRTAAQELSSAWERDKPEESSLNEF